MADAQSNIKVSIDTTAALASIKNLQRQISAFHTSMAQSGAAANAVTAQMQQNLINSINATGKFSAQMRTIRTTTESFTDSLQKNKFSLGEYFRYAGGASKSFGRLFKTEFETINKVARENVKDLQTQYIKMGRDANGAMRAISVRPLSLDMNDLATKTMIASEKQALLNQLLKQGSTNLLNFGKNTQWAGRQLMVGFTIPLMAAGSAAAKAFMDMETQAIRFKKVYGDLFTPQGESKQALEDIKELGKEFTKYGIAVSSTVGLAAEAAAAGFKGLDLQRQTTAATKLSILGQVESQKALETTIALQNAFAMSSDNLAESIDFLNAVENQTVLSLDDMSTAIPKAAPVVQQLGGDVKDLAFLMTAMKEGGINASEGANALKSGLASLINPTGKANDMLLSFGINAKKIVEDNKGNLKATVIEFASALNQLDPLNRAQVIEQMFGKFQFARLSTLFANVTKDGTQAARVLDLASASVQDLAAMSEKELGMTSESAMNKFKGAVENLKLALVPVGEEFLKAVTPIAEFVTKILDGFNNLGDGTKKIIITLTAVVAGLGPVLLMTFGLLANGIANIIKGFTFMKTLFNKTGQSSATLGTEVKYMTLEQRNAAAVAASLDQVHRTLAQTFTAEASAVDALTRAYQRSIAAQSQFVPSARPMTRGPITKRAEGKPYTVGGTGNKDSELSLLMPGETVIPTKRSKKYGALINGIIADSIPGYSKGKVSMYPEYALRLQDAAENMGQRSGTTGVPNVLSPLALRIGESRGIAPTASQINSGSFDNIYREYEDITTRFVEKLNSEYNETFADIKDENERMQRSWSSAGKHVAEQVDTIKSETERAVVKKTFGLQKDEYGTIPTDSREAGGTTPNRARRGAFKARLAGFRSYTAIRPGAKKLFSRMTGQSSDSLQMGHVYGPIQEDISTLQADPRRSGAVDSAAKILARGEQDGKEYKKGVEQSVKDPYVVSRDRNSPHELAAKDGKSDAIAYEDAKKKQMTQSGKPRRIATRAQGPANIGPAAPEGTQFLSLVSPLTDAESNRENKKKKAASRKNKLLNAGRKMNSLSGGMGLLGVNMAMSALPDFAGKGLAQGALTGANLGMMFGPQGMAIGAGLGAISSAISELIDKQKQLKAITEATFKSSADVATFFGNAVVDTTLKVGAFSTTLTGLSNAANKTSQSFGFTNEELARFNELIQALPENNPLKTVVEGLANEDNPEKINELAKAFITTQVAMGQLKPDQAQKTLDLILASSGHLSMVGSSFINLTTQVQAISLTLQSAATNSKLLGDTLIQLVGAAANSSSLAQMKLIIDGIGQSGLSTARALDAMYSAFLRVGNKDAANGVKVLRGVAGITEDEVAFIMGAAAKGFNATVTKDTNVKQLMKDAEAAVEAYDKASAAAGKAGDYTKTKAYKSQQEEMSGTKKQIDLLKKKKKLIDDQIKQQEKITNELKRQNDFLNTQRGLDQQILEAKIRGNYVEAASLLAEKQQNTVEFNKETAISILKSQSDKIQEQIDALELNNQKVVDAINKGTADAAKNADKIVAAVNNIKPGSITGPATSPNNPADANKVGGPSIAATDIDPKTGERVMSKDGLNEPLSKLRGGAAAWKVGDVVKIGPGLDVMGLQSADPLKPILSGSVKITKIDKNRGQFYYEPVVKKAKGGVIKHFNPGGKVSGPGTSTSDSIPALLSDGEYVFSAKAVDNAGGPSVVEGWHNSLRRAEGGPVQKFSTGGMPNMFGKGMDWFGKTLFNSGNSVIKAVAGFDITKPFSKKSTMEKLSMALAPLGGIGGGAAKVPGAISKLTPEMKSFQMADIDAKAINALKNIDPSSIKIPETGISFSPESAKSGLMALKEGVESSSIWEVVQAQREMLLKKKYPKIDFSDVSKFNEYYAKEFYGLMPDESIKLFKGVRSTVGSAWRTGEKDLATYFSTNPHVAALYSAMIGKAKIGDELPMFGIDRRISDLRNFLGEGAVRNGNAQGSMEFPQLLGGKDLSDILPSIYSLPGQVYGQMFGGAATSLTKIKNLWPSGFAKGGLANYKLPSYEVGSPYIPEDQIAQLHKGERVLTAQENKNFSSTGPVTNNITINGADKDPKQIAQEVMLQLERMQSKNNKTNLVGR
jgi:TP901 family phage tail tape measure protein